MAGFNILELDAVKRAEAMSLMAEYQRRRSMRLLDQVFPDAGPLRRALYPKHLEFFAAGAQYQERIFLAGNRVGKTVAAGTEWTYHLTGEYPDWWVGYRFDRPITLLAAGDTLPNTRDILQAKMLGGTTDKPEKIGTGLIPGRHITGFVRNPHVPGAIERAYVKHASGGESSIWLRSYEQGRVIFQGFELDGFWPDEECPQDVYEEGQIRLMTAKGLSTLTFTPLEGLTELVEQILSTPDQNEAANRCVVSCGWDDVPHLDEATKTKMLAKLPPHQRDARTKGIPQLGSGAIYPVLPEDVEVDDFQIPLHWKKAYGMDVGWNRTAAIFGAWDQDSDIIYITSEHYRGQAEPVVHAKAIQARGKWLTGAIDPAAKGRSQVDGQQLLKLYKNAGLNLVLADNSVEAGIYEVWERLSTGRLKIFKSCRSTMSEFKVYRRDKLGKIVKSNDHAMDALRYLIKTMQRVFAFQPKGTLRDHEVAMIEAEDEDGGWVPFDSTMNI